MSEKTPEKSQVEKLTYNTREVCQALGVSVTTLWRLVRAGKITPLNTGLRMRLYSVEDIRRFVARAAE
jgi:excisionase family DNA binding protein